MVKKLSPYEEEKLKELEKCYDDILNNSNLHIDPSDMMIGVNSRGDKKGR